MRTRTFLFWMMAGAAAMAVTRWGHAVSAAPSENIRLRCLGALQLNLQGAERTWRENAFGGGPSDECDITGTEVSSGARLLAAESEDGRRGLALFRVNAGVRDALAEQSRRFTRMGWSFGGAQNSMTQSHSGAMMEMFSGNRRLTLVAVAAGADRSLLLEVVEVMDVP